MGGAETGMKAKDGVELVEKILTQG